MNPTWAKGFARKGAALHGARRYDEAISAYEEGLKLEDSPAIRKGLKEVQDAKGFPASFYLPSLQVVLIFRSQLMIHQHQAGKVTL